MDAREQLQRDLLEELIAYSDNLIPALQTLIGEMKGATLEDTGDFLNEVLTGINWEIEVYNQCATLINEKSNYIDRKLMISAVNELGTTLQSGDKLRIAECLEQAFLPFLNKLAIAAQMVTGANAPDHQA